MAQRRLVAPPRGIFGNQAGVAAQIRHSSTFLYSANLLPATLALGDYDYFAVGIGNVGQGFTPALTPTETNLRTGGRVPDQQRFRIRELGFGMVSTVVVADSQKIVDSGYLWLDKPELKYFFGPPSFWPSGYGIVTPTTTLANNGWQTSTARMKFKQELILDPGESFTMKYTCTAAQTITATKTYIVLWGDSKTRVVSQ